MGVIPRLRPMGLRSSWKARNVAQMGLKVGAQETVLSSERKPVDLAGTDHLELSNRSHRSALFVFI